MSAEIHEVTGSKRLMHHFGTTAQGHLCGQSYERKLAVKFQHSLDQ